MACTLTSADYPEIRIALGLAGDDSTSLPDAAIEARAYLPQISRRVGAALADTGDACAFSCDSGDPDYDAEKAERVKDALVFLVAQALAAGWFGARADGRITSEGLGSLRVSYDSTNWGEVAEGLGALGIEALGAACPGAAALFVGDSTALDLMIADGPSRSRASKAAKAAARERELDPWGLGGP